MCVNKQEERKREERVVACVLSLAAAVQEANGSVQVILSKVLDHDITLIEFIRSVAAPNGIRFVYDPNHQAFPGEEVRFQMRKTNAR